VAINTAAIANPKFISLAANAFGSSTISISIEALKQTNGQYLAFTNNGREYTGVEVLSWAKQVESLGAGEIIITSIDNEGVGRGFDLELTKKIAAAVSIPVIACGGAGKLSDIKDVILTGQANAVALASVFHYEYISKHKKNYDKKEGNITFLNSGRSFKNVEPLTIVQVKKYLQKYKINCRL
jgi:cyclase